MAFFFYVWLIFIFAVMQTYTEKHNPGTIIIRDPDDEGQVAAMERLRNRLAAKPKKFGNAFSWFFKPKAHMF